MGLICLVRPSSKQGSGARIVHVSTNTGGFAADLLQVQPSATIGSIHDCRLEHHVLVVRGQQFTPPQFITAAQVFGELFQHDKREIHVPGHP